VAVEVLSLACRCLLVLVFLASSTGKLRRTAFTGFAAGVREAQLLPPRLVSPVLVAVVAAEAAVVVLLVLPWTARLGAALAAALLAAFIGVIALAVHRRSGLTCRCFGGSGAQLGPRHVTRNAALLLACLAVAIVPASLPERPEPAALAVVGAACLATLAIRLDDILDLVRPPART
jgi:uncharacterized membrane protein YphA (DoxX/SURF4 family)